MSRYNSWLKRSLSTLENCPKECPECEAKRILQIDYMDIPSSTSGPNGYSYAWFCTSCGYVIGMVDQSIHPKDILSRSKRNKGERFI